MDRPLVYPDEQLQETQFLTAMRAAYIGMSKLGAATVGSAGPYAKGFGLSPGTGLTVNIGNGELYFTIATDSIAYSSLPVDSDLILKQGLFFAQNNFGTFPAPVTAGQSIAYLVQIRFLEQDVDAVVLPYYNSANPEMPYGGPGNSGSSQDTLRQDTVTLSIKAGTPATTGTQVPPAPDSGYFGLSVVTVAQGDTTITNITRYSAGIQQDVNLDYLQASLKQALSGANIAYNPGDTSQLDALLRAYCPSGELKMYAGGAVPNGYLLCNGSAVSRATYSALFTAIGTTWGVGDGSTTFNVPDMRRRVPVGAGGSGTGVLGNAVGNVGGEETHTLDQAELPNVPIGNGVVDDTGIAFNNGKITAGVPGVATTTMAIDTGGQPLTYQGLTDELGSGNAHNNVQPSAIVNYIIKT